MASNGRDEKKEDRKNGIKKKRSMRCADDLELVKMILDENAPLRERVMRLLERGLNIENGQKRKPN